MSIDICKISPLGAVSKERYRAFPAGTAPKVIVSSANTPEEVSKTLITAALAKPINVSAYFKSPCTSFPEASKVTVILVTVKAAGVSGHRLTSPSSV